MGIRYRPEIDGLRAIAVLSVVLYHAGIGAAGFVGVDVFFVISGYLITSLLLKEHAATGSIDLLAFYARRVRRIFPAAAVVVLATLGASALLLEPEAQAQTAKSAGAALAFVANAFFQFTTGGYWDGASEEMPLLHLWSLSVEEQFYFVWPAMLLLVRSRKAMLVLAVASLGLAEFWVWRGSSAAFFQMPARFWELAAGGLLAAMPARRVPPWMAGAGVLVTLAACLQPFDHFPGVGALPAVIGACMVIGAVHCGNTNRILASKPMVSIGLISYSLYLWHWPLLAIYRANGGESMQVRMALCGVAVLLAIASYRYVEQPFRRMRLPSGRTVAIGASASALLALSACAIGLREPPTPPPADTTKEAMAIRAERDTLPRDCVYWPKDTIPKCPEPANPKVAFWGDSMALAWGGGMPEAVIYSAAACPPVLGQGDEGCQRFNEAVTHRLDGVNTVYLVARWQDHPHFDLSKTLAFAKGKRVVIIGPTPEMLAGAPRCIRGKAHCTIPRARFEKSTKAALARLREQAATLPNVEVVDMTDEFCERLVCPPVKAGMPLYFDTHHVTKTKARAVLTSPDIQAYSLRQP